MKSAATILFSLLFATPLMAQHSAFGFLIGGAQPADNGLDIQFSGTAREVFYETEMEPGTLLRFKLGQVDSERPPLPIGIPNYVLEGKTEYIDAFVEYRFYESFGSTGLFAGPGLYRRRFGNDEETDYGLAGGVNGVFPLTRRFAFLAELTYRWANFEERKAFVTATGGLRVSF